MAYKKWIVSSADKERASELAEICDVDPFLALIALSRGIETPEDLEMFLSEEPILSSQYELPDIEKAAEVINEAIEKGSKIAVFGDYDCDGITSTVLFYSYLKKRNADVIYYLPDRFSDGYGMNNNAIDYLKGQGVELIITVDNGISAVQEVEYAKSLEIGVVITDHHIPPEILPNALAVVDPHLENSACAFKEISGVLVAFKVVCAVENCEPEELLPDYADLLAIGLVADVMPLKEENRSIVKEGVKAINNTKKMGIIALLNSAGIGRGKVTAGNIAFMICPRLNAAGRIDSPLPAAELLLCEDFNRANELASLIEEQNRTRQAMEQQVVAEAALQIEQNNYQYQRVIVASGKNWHQGVLGIAAARITEKYGKPTILLNEDEELASGSGRSISGFSLFDALKAVEGILTKYGGHQLAAGLTLKKDDIALLREEINKYANIIPAVVPTLKLDCKLNIQGITLDLAEAINELEPFGAGNPSPVFGLYNLEITRISEVCEGRHTKLLLSRNGAGIQVMCFGIPTKSFPFIIGDVIDVAASISINEYSGNRNVAVKALAVRKSGVDEDAFFLDFALYDAFKNGEEKEYPSITRQEIGMVYRTISETVPRQMVIQRFIGNLGYFKTCVAIDILEELGLAVPEKIGYFRYLTAEKNKKSNLESSKIFKRLGGDING